MTKHEVTNHNDKPCPSCGYCPTCGRANAQRWVPTYPTPYWQQPWITYTSGSYTTTADTTLAT